MIKVNNSRAISSLANGILKKNKFRNIIAVMAIALTSIMLTGLITVTANMVNSMEGSTMRQVGTKAHGGYKFLTMEQYDKVKANPAVKNISYNIILGNPSSEELSKLKCELRYSEDNDAKWGFAYPESGKMPVAYDEIAADTQVLDALGAEHKIGEKITLSYITAGVEHTDSFVLSGFWNADNALPAHEIWVSKDYTLDNVKLVTTPYFESENYDFSGTVNCSLWFGNSFNIESKVAKLSNDCEFDRNQINEGVNWAYSFSSLNLEFSNVIVIVLILALIVFSGYLIIFNIFYISVAKDIRFFGMLKTIGATGKQLKKIVRIQAMKLSLIGIPIGLILGLVVGNVVTPLILKLTNISAESNTISPVVIICAALFTLITVLTSCRKPCKMASKVSPIDALRFNDSNCKKLKRKSRKITSFSLAWANLGRSKKKAAIVVASLSLSMILLNSVYSITKSFDMDKYIAKTIISDFSVENSAFVNNYEAGATVDNEILEKLKTIDGVTDFSTVMFTPGEIKLEGSGFINVKKMIDDHKEYFESKYSCGSSQHALQDKKMYTFNYGVEKLAFDKLTYFDKKPDYNKFVSGNYVILSTLDAGSKEYPFYKSGEKLIVDFPDGNSKEYTVLALAAMPSAISANYSTSLCCDIVFPMDEYLSHYNDNGAIHAIMNCENDKVECVEKEVKQICESTSMQYTSKRTCSESFKDIQKMYVVIGGALSFILALIGILNFVNSSVTSVLSRKKELAMLQSLGMTGKQMKKMLVCEGLCYAVLTTVFTLSFGSILSYFIAHTIAGEIWFFTYKFTVLPVLICIPIMCAIAVIVPLVIYKNISHESVVERLREGE